MKNRKLENLKASPFQLTKSKNQKPRKLKPPFVGVTKNRKQEKLKSSSFLLVKKGKLQKLKPPFVEVTKNQSTKNIKHYKQSKLQLGKNTIKLKLQKIRTTLNHCSLKHPAAITINYPCS